MRWRPVVGTCGALLVAAAIVGCGSDPEPAPAPEPEPTRLQLTISATDDVNPDAHGAPSLIVTRLFLLRRQSAFAAAEFFALWDKEQAVLAGDLLSREELVLRPGQTTTLKSIVDKDARVLGVAAAYQDIDHATWRAIGSLSPARVNAFKLELSREAVTLQPLPEKDASEKGSDEKKKEGK